VNCSACKLFARQVIKEFSLVKSINKNAVAEGKLNFYGIVCSPEQSHLFLPLVSVPSAARSAVQSSIRSTASPVTSPPLLDPYPLFSCSIQNLPTLSYLGSSLTATTLAVFLRILSISLQNIPCTLTTIFPNQTTIILSLLQTLFSFIIYSKITSTLHVLV